MEGGSKGSELEACLEDASIVCKLCGQTDERKIKGGWGE